jgi:uncharacterized protein with WD repeat
LGAGIGYPDRGCNWVRGITRLSNFRSRRKVRDESEKIWHVKNEVINGLKKLHWKSYAPNDDRGSQFGLHGRHHKKRSARNQTSACYGPRGQHRAWTGSYPTRRREPSQKWIDNHKKKHGWALFHRNFSITEEREMI